MSESTAVAPMVRTQPFVAMTKAGDSVSMTLDVTTAHVLRRCLDLIGGVDDAEQPRGRMDAIANGLSASGINASAPIGMEATGGGITLSEWADARRKCCECGRDFD